MQATLLAAWAKIRRMMHRLLTLWGTSFFDLSTLVAPPFEVPPTPIFLEELKHCWADSKAFSRHGRDARTLASMRNAGEHDLDHMTPVDQCITLLVLPPH